MAHYELYDKETANLVGYLDDKHDAALSVRDLAEANLDAYTWLIVGILSEDDQRIGWLEGKELEDWVNKELGSAA